MNQSDSGGLSWQPLAAVGLLLAVFVMIGGVMILFGVGPAWFHNSITVASLAMLVPLAVHIRRRTVADRNRPCEQEAATTALRWWLQ